MAATRDSIYEEARKESREGAPSACKYKPGCWQHTAYTAGWLAGQTDLLNEQAAARAKAAGAAEVDKLLEDLGLGKSVNRVFPARMPAPVKAHIMRLDYDALGTRDSTRALRLDRKITKLYERYA